MHFSLPNIDHSQISLKDFPEAKGFIIVFTCNHCPYAIAYEQRLKQLNETYAPQGFPLIAINSNDPVKYPQDSFDNMVIRAEQKGFSFPYLFDETQTVARAYQAERTPHAFLLQKDSDGLKLIYQGAIDDNYRDERAVRQSYLIDKVESLLAGDQLEYSETPAIGCTIKWK